MRYFLSRARLAMFFSAFAFSLLVVGLMGGNAVASVSEASGLGGGLAYWPSCTKPDAVLTLATSPTWRVAARCPDAATAAALRKAAIDKGLLAQRLWVSIGAGETVPYADYSLDLIVCEDAALATPAALGAWKQALTSRRGVLLLPKSVVRPAIEALGGVIAEAGEWLRVSFPPREGGDQWTHRLHSPDNQLISADRLFKPPFLPQWYALPLHSGFWGTTTLVAGGRLYNIRSINKPGLDSIPKLECRSLGNGSILWTRPLAEAPIKNSFSDFLVGRSAVIALDSEILVSQRGKILRLAPETGTEVSHIALATADAQVKWMGIADGRLVVLTGAFDEKKGGLATISLNPHGRLIVAYNLADGKEVWRIEEDADIDERTCALAAGKLYHYRAGKGLRARDAATGKEIWTSPAGDIFAFQDRKFAGSLPAMPLVVVARDTLLCGSSWTENFTVLSEKDGSKLWQKLVNEKTGRSLQDMVTGDVYHTHHDGTLNLLTGEPAEFPGRMPRSGCGPTISTPDYFLTAFGACAAHTTPDDLLRRSDIKGACDIGVQVADGIMLSASSSCQCVLPVTGWRTIAHANSWKPHTMPATPRLEKIAPSPAAGAAASPQDWPAARHDVRRSGATPAAVGTVPKTAWHWKPIVLQKYDPSGYFAKGGSTLITMNEQEFRPTAAISVAGKSWFVDAQGVVRCLDSTTGQEIWSQALPTDVLAPPAYLDGMLYIGGGDGILHSFDAATGSPVWRFRVAPGERNILFHGRLWSSWPLHGGLAAQDGAVYAVAGFQPDTGIHAVALDARTGDTRWSSDDTGLGDKSLDPSRTSTSSYSNLGAPAINAGRLWIPTANLVPGSFDLATGKPRFIGLLPPGSPALASIRHGENVLAFTDQWTLVGGRRFWLTEDLWGRLSRAGTNGFTAVSTISRGGSTEVINFIRNINHAPVWDKEICVMPTDTNEDICSYAVSDIVKILDTVPSYTTKGYFPVPCGSLLEKNRGGGREKMLPEGLLFQWEKSGEAIEGLALAGNAVIMTAATITKTGKTGEIGDWSLVACNRADGTELWRLPLPAQPTHDSLSIDSDGRILVPMRDGSIICISTK